LFSDGAACYFIALFSLLRLFRPSEQVALCYFAYTAVVAWVRPIDPSIRHTTWVLNLTVAAAYCLAAYADSFRRKPLLGILRDWFALALLLLAYREMGWFALPHKSTLLEQGWVVWDRLFLDRLGVRALVELAGPVIPAILEAAYSLVYAVAPFCLAVLYAYRRRKDADELLFPTLLAVLGCYVLFPFFPSEPPRTVFPGQDMPIVTGIRSFNAWLLGSYGIHTSVFPSAHVAGAFSSALALRRLLPAHRALTRAVLVLASLIALSTVYGRYHYLVDALAGLALALAAARVTGLVYRRGS
jgi:membrane-associated phospholipid phosphatase